MTTAAPNQPDDIAAIGRELRQADGDRARQEYSEALKLIQEAATDPATLDALRGLSIDQINTIIARRLAAATKP